MSYTSRSPVPVHPPHSDRIREAAATTLAPDRTQVAATALAEVVAALLTEPEVLVAARAEFDGVPV
ncbi:hypothetical protein [Streptomyces phaeochromogenes]|uniref:hypothetical protein n=1 Tax=Streptomyces phaeochromogenes TaxID=1923 RepID=UPI0036A1E328